MLLLPWATMRVTNEVRWDADDFAIFGVMLAVAGGGFELTVRLTPKTKYRVAIGVALAAAFVFVWLELAVGIVGP